MVTLFGVVHENTQCLAQIFFFILNLYIFIDVFGGERSKDCIQSN